MDRDYRRVADAIDYIATHARTQPSLERVAAHVGLSPFHFQRIFRRYAGVTPKQFLAALTLDSAKVLLDDQASVLDASLEVGLSSPARLHDHFVTLEAMTPGEYKNEGGELTIRLGLAQTPFGVMRVGTTARGICMLDFADDAASFESPTRLWPRATFVQDDALAHTIAQQLFEGEGGPAIHLHVRGTNFQVRVWNALLSIHGGAIRTYKDVALAIGEPTASRAVGNAIAHNPVGLLIPCHRVITSTGSFGSYRWGAARKRALLAWEHARKEQLPA